jgi:hypothetical protein
MLEVDPNPVPERKATAHAVDEDIGRLEVRHDGSVASFPALEAGQGLFLRGGAGDLNEWLG